MHRYQRCLCHLRQILNMINISEIMTTLLRVDQQEGHDQDRLEEHRRDKIQSSLKKSLMFACLIEFGHLRLQYLERDQDLVTTMTIQNVEEEQHAVKMDDFHVVRDHVTIMTTKMLMYRRQDQLVRDPDLEMMTNNAKDRDLETILGDKIDLGQETMIMIMWIGAQYILVDYDPSTRLATEGQHMRRKVHHRN